MWAMAPQTSYQRNVYYGKCAHIYINLLLMNLIPEVCIWKEMLEIYNTYLRQIKKEKWVFRRTNIGNF